jgi:hypothetical protein
MTARVADSPSSRTVVVAGTAGGVGTTTVAALFWGSFGTAEAPALLDHSGGELGRRITGGDDVLAVDTGLSVLDLGAHALDRGVARLADTREMLLVVTAATPNGIAAAHGVLTAVRDAHGSPGLSRTVVVPVGAFGRRRIARDIEALQTDFGGRYLVPLPRDIALAGGGRIPANRLSAETRRGQQRLARLVRDRLRMF